MNVDIVIPVFNQLHYTKKCIEGVLQTVKVDGRIIIVDNGSTDGTAEYLASIPGIEVIDNKYNLGVAVAWNQGVRAGEAEWVVLLNNDVILTEAWLEGLIGFATDERIDVVSPAIREGECNYDIAEYSRSFVRLMGNVARRGIAEGICFMVHRRVFEAIGLFDEKFRIGQFEDTDFFRRANAAGFKLGITGLSFIHHFGSVTQKAFGKLDKSYANENRTYFRKKWNLTRWKRFWQRRKAKFRELFWRTSERLHYGHSLKEKWINGKLHYY